MGHRSPTNTMDPAAIRACQFAAWYPSFREVAFRSVIIPLPPAFVEYLVQDGVFLPEGSDAVCIALYKQRCPPRAPKEPCKRLLQRRTCPAELDACMHAAQLPRRAQLAAHEDYEAWEQEACEAVDPQQEAAQVMSCAPLALSQAQPSAA